MEVVNCDIENPEYNRRTSHIVMTCCLMCEPIDEYHEKKNDKVKNYAAVHLEPRRFLYRIIPQLPCSCCGEQCDGER